LSDSPDIRFRALLSYFFGGSAQLPLLDSVDLALERVCQLVVDSGMFRGAVLLTADEKFRVRHAGFHATAPDALEELRVHVREMEGHALRPYDFTRASREVGTASLIDPAASGTGGLWSGAGQLIIPITRADALVVGFLTAVAPDPAQPLDAEDVRLLEVLLQHCSAQVENIRTRAEMRSHADQLEHRLQDRAADARLAQEKFARLVNASRDVVLVTDERDLLVYINQAFEGAFGLARENFLGRSFQTVLRESAIDRAAIDEALAALERLPEDFVRIEIDLRNATGSRRTFELVRTVFRQAGIARGAQCVLHDITDQRALFNHLLTSERLALTGRMAAGVAHEINNPLQAILSQLSALQAKVDSDAAGDHVERIREAIDRIRQVLRGMSDLNRSGNVAQGAVQMNAVIESTLSLLKPQLKHAAIEVHTELSTDLPALTGSFAELQQLLHNLVLNAIEAMPDGGELIIQSNLTAAGIDLVVRDRGEGIQPEFLPHIFEPFFTRKPTGSGLGLYISKGIVERHDAAIHVESSPGQGATFTVTFPPA
jgi:PAS domain S-box-containing protein